MWYIHTTDYYSAMRKEEILTFVTTWIGLEVIMLIEISQIDKRQILHGITYMWNLRKKNVKHKIRQ